MEKNLKQIFCLPVIVAALGYFVDIYDLLLFSIVRTSSLEEIGFTGQDLLNEGVYLINMQMAGMLIGGVLWGIMGDKKGRLSVLFGSILLYSLANILNGFIENEAQYATLRFIAGVGLAGELGAGITLVAEILPRNLRGYGTSLVAGLGLLGAVVGGVVVELFDWRTAYIIGGGLGMLLLLLRVSVRESGVFKKTREKNVSRGNFLALFVRRERFVRYARCILIGLPIWFVIGVLMTFSPEFGIDKNLSGPVEAGKAVMYGYIGLSMGDILSGILSQYWKSRKKAVAIFILATAISIGLYLYFPWRSSAGIYFSCWLLGLSIGYWALFVTIAAEQFGTNLRATVATTVPNFIRGTVVPISFLFLLTKNWWGITTAGLAVGLATVVIAAVALWRMEETFSRRIDFIEGEKVEEPVVIQVEELV